MKNARIATLATRLEAANDAYRKGEAIISDDAYDALEAELRKLDSDHPTLVKIGAPGTDGWPKVKHPIPMGSLNKAQTDAEFLDWASKFSADLFLSEKLDGISILLTYTGGDLDSAVTRGDGVEGEDITRNVRLMKGVPSKIPFVGTAYVRGEIVVLKPDFQAHFQGESNPRNTAAGTAKRQSDWRKCEHLSVLAYNLTTMTSNGSVVTRSQEFTCLGEWGFETPNFAHYQGPVDAQKIVQIRGEYVTFRRDSLDYEIDGLVIELDHMEVRVMAGAQNMKPKGAIAFKFPHDSAETVLRDIRWQVGNSGRITPVAIFDSVPLAGANVKQASLHNLSNIQTLTGAAGQEHPFPGDHILVSRRNDVIPYVEAFLGTNEDEEGDLVPLGTPTNCPACNAAVIQVGEYLVCSGEDCPAQVLGALKRWITKNSILHFGEALLIATIEAGLVATIGDIYRLKEDAFAALEMDGRRVGGMAKRALKSVEAKRELTLDYLVGSLGIPLVGRKMALLLIQAGFDDLDKMSQAKVTELAAVEGFGQTKAEAFRQGFDDRKRLILDILAAGVTIKIPEVIQQTSSSMVGEAVCMTGFRDAAMEDAIKAAGGSIASGVSKNTTILVCKDKTSTSGKAQKARDLGLTLLEPADMWARLGA